jgi:hypothetical protein
MSYKYNVYLRLRANNTNKCLEYDKAFHNFLENYEIDSQSGLCVASFNGSDEGTELFIESIKTFEEAKNLAIKTACFWLISEPYNNIFDLTIKYAEPTFVGRTIPEVFAQTSVTLTKQVICR